MSFKGMDMRCTITRLDIKNIVKKFNDGKKMRLKEIPIHFAINEESSRCLREYIDLLLMDVANKYVNMIKYNNNNRKDALHEKEKLIIGTILRQSDHLITKDIKSKQTLNECFVQKTNKPNKPQLNPIFLKR